MLETQSGPTMRVLYVDDDAALVRLVQKSLGRRGFEVIHAANGEEALRRRGGDSFDVVALDHYLSDGTGLDFLERLTSGAASPAVVYVTGSTEMNVAVAALKAGAADFVPKTIGDDFLTLLGSALEQAVEKARLRAQKEAAEREVRIAKDRAETLLAEVNHRVANSLALVSSMVNLQAKSLDNQAAREALVETQQRIYAIALVHKRLYTSGEVGIVDLDAYLTGLLEHLATTQQTVARGISLRHDLQPVQLKTDASINLGVIVTEWVTNAFKYAYPDQSGEVRVSLKLLEGDRAALSVEDDGIGRDNDAMAKGTGFGSRIVKAMAATMNGEIDYVSRQPGTTAQIVFPLKPA